MRGTPRTLSDGPGARGGAEERPARPVQGSRRALLAGSYDFGSLVITMGDVKNAAPGGSGKLPLIWTSSSRGILSEYYTPASRPAVPTSTNRRTDHRLNPESARGAVPCSDGRDRSHRPTEGEEIACRTFGITPRGRVQSRDPRCGSGKVPSPLRLRLRPADGACIHTFARGAAPPSRPHRGIPP